MPDGPSIQMSFANNFWGKDDAGVEPLLQRMHNAKQTCDELKSFYTVRAAIEDEYARKLLSLSRKPLGSQESGTLRASLDVLRGEVEAMGKSHQNVAGQMKTELEEPLAAFAGAMKERRKIVQGGIEKLLKVKVQQAQLVNKTRDRYEQECLKIKGYLAQGHMVMGQEERKNKAKLEKTQINLATSNTEYENAVKALEETTGRWNRDWKAAADKFQDLEEERLDFMKSSLWSFANIASTVCVSDDASCEKVRLSLENCEVEKDIASFIKERGTGQEIPDPPKYINFCRGDVSDTQSEASEDESYSVAQFPRTINPAYRSSSPQPSTYESHHDPHSAVARESGHNSMTPPSRKATLTPQKGLADRSKHARVEDYQAPTPRQDSEEPPQSLRQPQLDYNNQQRQPQIDYQRPQSQQQQNGDQLQARQLQQSYQVNQSRQPQPRQAQLGQTPPNRISYEQSQRGALAAVPHDPYPMDGMTMLCRTGPPSDRSSAHSAARPSSRDSNSEYSNPTSFSSQEPPSGKTSPIKQVAPSVEKQVLKKKSGFFQGHSPFRRKSNKEKDNSVAMKPSSRNTWSASRPTAQSTLSTRPQLYGQDSQNMISDRPSGSPEPIDPRASFQLNVGNNVFDVAAPEQKKKSAENDPAQQEEDLDPIAQALAELKGVTKASSTRMSADKYHGILTPAPGSTPASRPGAALANNGALMAGMRGTPPPSYDQPVSRLGAPQPAFTSKAMQQTRQKYVDQTQNMFNAQTRPGSQGYGSGPNSRPGTRGSDMPRATSPAPQRSASPRPDMQVDTRQAYRSSSPNPYGGSQRNRAQSATPQKRGSDQSYYRHNSPNDIARAVSPAPFRDQERPNSSHMGNDMSMQMQLAPAGDEGYGSQNGRGSRSGGSASSRTMSYYGGSQGEQQLAARSRSKSVADVRQFSRDGRPILHFARAMYMYQAAIPEELSFAKGDILAVLRLQDDGWWEAEVTGKNGYSSAAFKQNHDLETCDPSDVIFLPNSKSSGEQRQRGRRQRQHQRQSASVAVGATKEKMDLVMRPIRVATSKPAQQTYINTILFMITSVVLLGLAAFAYILLYLNYVPQIGIERFIHLQYGDGSHPYGITSLDASLISQQAYDISLSLHVPRSPSNLAQGNFMLSLSLLSPSYKPALPSMSPTYTPKLSPASEVDQDDILFFSRRPAILTYASQLVSSTETLFSLPLYLLHLKRESEVLHVPMAELATFPKGWKKVPGFAMLELQSEQEVQVYNVRIQFKARFGGLRWVMYNHRITSFVVFTFAFWISECIFAILGWVAVRAIFAKSGEHVKKDVKGEETDTTAMKNEEDEEDEPDLSETPRTFPTYGRQPPLRYTPKIKDEDGGDYVIDETAIQPLTAEADDEDEEEFQHRTGRTDSGIGTSFSEGGERAGVKRRTSRGGR